MRPLLLGKELNRGGAAGSIFEEVGHQKSVIKIYHTPELARNHKEKLAAMLLRPPNLSTIFRDGQEYVQVSWPTEVVIDSNGALSGFAMPLIDFKKSTELELLLQKASRKAEKLPEQYTFRLTAARNLAAIFTELHALGHYIIDAKPMNLRVYRASAVVAALDCDGFHITGADSRRYPAAHFTDGYICPEAKGERPETLGVNQDNFALAVMLFQLLNNGLHPFQGRFKPGMALASDDIQTRIYAYSFAYGRAPDRYQAPSPFSMHEFFADETRTMFEQAFGGGTRPTAAAWRDHLDKLLRKARPCPKEPALHLDFGKGCGSCSLEQRLAANRAIGSNQRPNVAGQVQIVLPTRRAANPKVLTAARHPVLSIWHKQRGWIIAASVIAIWLLANIGGNRPNNVPAQPPVALVGPSVLAPTRRITDPPGSREVTPPSSVPEKASNVPSPSVTTSIGPTLPSAVPREASAAQAPLDKPSTRQPPSSAVPAEASTTQQPRPDLKPFSADLVAVRNLHVREGPSEDAPILETVTQGTPLTAIGRVDNAWLAVKRNNGTGYVYEGYTSNFDGWRRANTVHGPVQAIRNVSTVFIGGHELRLSGILPLAGDYDQRLLAWLHERGGDVQCTPIQGALYRCLTAYDRDIAQAAILNGFGVATSGSPGEYKESEAQARQARRGYWLEHN